MDTIYKNYGNGTVKLTWKKTDQLPERRAITSVHAVCFHEELLMLVNLNHRGWDFPGGHIESGESPEQCVEREVFEEGYVSGQTALIGYITVDHSENVCFDPEGKYPLIGYQPFYRMDIACLHPFEGAFESDGRTFIPPEAAAKVHKDWHVLFSKIICDA